MKGHFLETKFHIPGWKTWNVSRPRLLDQLARGLDRKLTLVSAPAGFGKTTLLCEWCDQQIKGGRAEICWLSLHPGDDETGRFWLYFVGALQPALPQVGRALLERLDSVEQVEREHIFTLILNETASREKDLVLILDDFHVVTSPAIHQEMAFLIEHLPDQFHLVLSTRLDPPWPLARLRSQQEIVELRQQDLRFSIEEASAFLNSGMNIHLPTADLQALEARTEGWIAGLQMAALSLQNRTDASTFIQSFTGSHRFVLDYLIEEVLDQQPAEVRDFLLKTSILEQLNDALCGAVLGSHQGELTLSALEQQNLFLIPLDDRRQWYRYHHLFADLLRNQLAQSQPEAIPELHRRACHWHREQGLIFEAVQHALAANDFELAADLVEQNLITFKDHGELPTVMRWLEAFPEAIVEARPWLCISKCWVLAYLGEPDSVKSLLNTAETALSEQASGSSSQHIYGHIAAIRCYLALFDGELESSARYGRQALELLAENDVNTRISAATTLASALRLNGNLSEADQVLRKAIALSRKAGSSAATTRLLCALAALQHTQGQLNQALESLAEAVRTAKIKEPDGSYHDLPGAGHAYIRMANFLATQYRLDEALEKVKIGLDLSQQWGQANALWEGYRIEAGVRASLGDLAGAQRAMKQSAAAARRISGQLAMRSSTADQALLFLEDGDIAAAAACIEQLGLETKAAIPYQECELYGTWAYVLIAQGKPAEALGLLEKMVATVEKVGAIHLLLDMHLLSTLAYQKMGAETQALESLAKAVVLAEPAGFARDFVDEGEALRPLLLKLRSRGQSTAFIGKLLGWIAEKHGRGAHIPGLIEALSERELQVLQLLNTALDSQQIADHLVISVSTVRTHIRNIYAKLGVSRRMEAIQRGRELGLL